MTTTLYLARHGETEGSKADVYGGRGWSPVTEKGGRQMERLLTRLESLEISAVYSSPIDRCLDAANAIAASLNLIAVPVSDLIEIENGAWEGLSRLELRTKFSEEYRRWEADPAANRPDRGESGYDVARRSIPAIWEIVRRHPNQSVVAMAHSTVNRILMCHFLGLPLIEYRKRIFQYPASLNCVLFLEDHSFQVTLLNDTSHLRDLDVLD